MTTKLLRYVLAGGVLVASTLQAQTIPAVVEALQQGGHVIVMRHASSPNELPDATTRRSDNTEGERQLDARGRETATAMGEALRRLQIPITEVMTSPTYRARETARALGLQTFSAQEELSNEGMQSASAEKANWLRNEVVRIARDGNRLLITHQPNIRAAFSDLEGLEDGEALIFSPDGSDEPVLQGRIKIEEWQGF